MIAAALNTTYSDGPGSLDAMLAGDGITGVPIAYPLTTLTPSGSHTYQATLRQRGIDAGLIDANRTYEDAVTVYRRALANASSQVDIIAIGYVNNLKELLQSAPDGYSSLTGAQLVASKVRVLWLTAGVYPSGTEFNFADNAAARSAASYVTANWPTPIVYSGYDIGVDVISGESVKNTQATDLLAQALVNAGYSNGRASWDDLGTLVAVISNPNGRDYTSIFGSNAVSSADGSNVFTAASIGRDRYLIKRTPNATFKQVLNQLFVKSNWPSYYPY